MRISQYTSSESLCNWIFEFADFGIILTDTELRITDVNKWVEDNSARLGMVFKGNLILDMFPEIRQRGLEHYLRDALNGASVILTSTFHKYFLQFPLTADNPYEFMRQTVRITPLVNRETVYGLIIHIEDVTERIKREELLQKKNEELLKLNSTKDKFFSIISHDLRSPFTTLLGISEMLKDDDNITSEKTRNLVTMLHTAIKNQFRFLENMLEWARIQSRQHELVFSEISLNKIISHILKVSVPQAESKGVRISASCIPDEIRLISDSQALTSVLHNLLFNAIKFTRPGGYVEIRAAQTDNATIIAVKDNGIGMPAERVQKLFRIDESVSTPGTNDEKGSGLGLILVKEIVDKLKGTITVESEPEKGSIFFVTLPIRES